MSDEAPRLFPRLSLNLAGLARSVRGAFRDYGKRVEEFGSEKKRRELHEELFHRSYFADLKALRVRGGKLSEADDRLAPSHEARAVPAVPARLLTMQRVELPTLLRGQVTLLLVGFRDFSRIHLETYQTPFLSEFEHTEGVQCFELSYIDSVVMRWFTPMFIRNMKKVIPLSRHRYFGFASEGNPQKLQRQLDIVNILVGQAYLVDRHGLVRWKAHGTATPFEVETMLKLTKTLCKEPN